MDALRHVLAEMSRPNQSQASAVHLRKLPIPVPSILSAPSMFQDGQIIGKNFGARPGWIKMHLRVKQLAEQGPYSSETFEGPGPEKLLGNLDGTNYLLLTEDTVDWHNDRIQLKYSPEFWGSLMYTISNVAAERGIPPPQASDLEVGYLVETADGANS